MKHIRLLAVLLCLLLTLSLAACGGDPAPTTVPTTQPPETTVPTEPPLDPVAFYADAVAALESGNSCSITSNRVKTVEMASESLTEDYQQTMALTGDVISVNSSITYSGNQVFVKEIWAGDAAYLNLNGNCFQAETDRETYLDRYAPVQLLTAENYASVTAEEGETIVITFTEPTAVETWLAPEGCTLVSAAGSATLTPDGTLTGCTYDLTYSYGGVTITEDWDVTYADVKNAPSAPEDPDSYLSVESIDAPLLLEQAKSHLLGAETVSASISQLVSSQAVGYVCEMQRQVDVYDGMYRFVNYITESNGKDSQRYEVDELFRDGVYSIAVDGEKPQENAGINEKVLEVYADQLLSDPIYGSDSIASCAVTDLGSVLLVECTGNEAWGDAIRAVVCGSFMTDPYALDNAATNIADITSDFYIAVDKYTGTPTSYGYEYECTHSIQNAIFILNGQNNISYDIASLCAYENITEEPAPDKEAEAPTPLLYHVTGADDQEMWLFGTIHVGDDRTGYLPQVLVDALVNADALALECDTEGFDALVEKDKKLAQKVMDAYYYADEATAKDFISDSELYDKAVKMMKASGNYSYMLEYQKLFLWESSIDNFYLRQGHQLSSEKGLESRLLKIAEENDVPLREVESVLFQIQMNAGWSQELQEWKLKELLELNGVAYALSVQELYDLWCAGDEAALIEAIADEASEITEQEQPLYDEYNKAISTDRNAGMLEVAKDYLESGDTVFYAVGLAHLLAEDGLVNTLRAAGYTVELVSYE